MTKCYCSFCHKSQDDVRVLLASKDQNGVEVFICDECADVAISTAAGHRGTEIRGKRRLERARLIIFGE